MQFLRQPGATPSLLNPCRFFSVAELSNMHKACHRIFKSVKNMVTTIYDKLGVAGTIIKRAMWCLN